MTFDTWYDGYYERIGAWITDCSIGRPATLILNLPYLLQFCLHLLADERTPSEFLPTLQQSSDYVLRGMEYLPPNELAVTSLVKDAERLAQVLAPNLVSLKESGLSEQWCGYDTLEEIVLGIIGVQELAPACIVSAEHHFLAMKEMLSH